MYIINYEYELKDLFLTSGCSLYFIRMIGALLAPSPKKIAKIQKNFYSKFCICLKFLRPYLGLGFRISKIFESSWSRPRLPYKIQNLRKNFFLKIFLGGWKSPTIIIIIRNKPMHYDYVMYKIYECNVQDIWQR